MEKKEMEQKEEHAVSDEKNNFINWKIGDYFITQVNFKTYDELGRSRRKYYLGQITDINTQTQCLNVYSLCRNSETISFSQFKDLSNELDESINKWKNHPILEHQTQKQQYDHLVQLVVKMIISECSKKCCGSPFYFIQNESHRDTFEINIIDINTILEQCSKVLPYQIRLFFRDEIDEMMEFSKCTKSQVKCIIKYLHDLYPTVIVATRNENF